MTSTSPEQPPIACTLLPAAFKERVAWIAELNRGALLAHCRDGLRLELTYAPGACEQVREMVRRERECCGFLTFDVREEPDAVRVTIDAPEVARETIMEAVFDCFQAKTSTR